MSDEDVMRLADRMFRSIEAADLESLRACYSPQLQSWSNYDDRTVGVDQTLKLVGWLCSKLTDRRYDVRRREVIDGGFLQEHVLRGTAPDGSEVAMPACVVATVDGGRIAVIREYLDPAGLAALSA